MLTLTLEESREILLDLTPDQAAALRAVAKKLVSTKQWWGDDAAADDAPDSTSHRSPIRCLDAGEGRYRVTVYNAVGLIALRDLQLAVQPKIPQEHLLYLFAQSGEFPRLDTLPAHGATGAHLWDLLAHWYVAAAENVLQADLIRDYHLVGEELPVIRGRTAPLAVTRAVYGGRLSFPCEFDDFTANTPLNRTLKAAAFLVASHTLHADTRHRARTLVARMDDIGPYQYADLYTSLDRRTRHFADAFTLARHLLTHQARLLAGGDTLAWTFLIPTPSLVEAALLRILHDHLVPTWLVEKRGRQLPNSTLTFNADLVFSRPGSSTTTAIGDVKYKLATTDWNRADLYQLIAFATAFTAPTAALVTFRRPLTAPLTPLQVGPVHVSELSWPADEAITPTDAARLLAERTALWLEMTS
jgi:5-methylcytosine-specific restriction endonuclease McrBC regulatory subunit McrC